MTSLNNLKYLDHNTEKEITELESLSNSFVIMSRMLNENVLITRASYYLPIGLLIIESALFGLWLFLFLSLILPVNSIIKTDFINIDDLFSYIFLAFLLMWTIIHIVIRTNVTRKLSKATINFKENTLTVSNIDPIGKYIYNDFSCSLKEIKRLISYRDKNLLNYRSFEIDFLLYAELLNGDIHYLTPISDRMGFDRRRYIELLSNILKL
ncbi:hypothetical protein [Labilibacter marinus]|uniref:hypothetical protein n=1 Tax=Labilibacter marinus TaxID=1477105 RepID=UPI000833863C|nr:hypothetical protein [Labilibacter marinus]